MAPQHPGKGLLDSEQWQAIADHFHLTPRELSVAVLLFEGKTRYQIGRELRCAAGTVRTYIDRLFSKLAVKDRLAMALQVIRTLSRAGYLRLSHKSATGEVTADDYDKAR